MLRRLKRTYPKIWPFVFLAGGITASIWGGHLHFNIFGEAFMLNLHTMMWFLMAFAHAEVFWRHRGGDEKPSPRGD